MRCKPHAGKQEEILATIANRCNFAALHKRTYDAGMTAFTEAEGTLSSPLEFTAVVS